MTLIWQKPNQENICASFECIYWNIINLPVITPLKETGSSFPSSFWLLVALQLGVGLCELLPYPCWNFGGLDCAGLVRGVTFGIIITTKQQCGYTEGNQIFLKEVRFLASNYFFIFPEIMMNNEKHKVC